MPPFGLPVHRERFARAKLPLGLRFGLALAHASDPWGDFGNTLDAGGGLDVIFQISRILLISPMRDQRDRPLRSIEQIEAHSIALFVRVGPRRDLQPQAQPAIFRARLWYRDICRSRVRP